MKHIIPIIIKFGLVAITVFSIFSAFQNVTLWNALFISIFLVALGYVLGDLVILRRFGNFWATLSDFALAFLVLFFYGISLNIPYSYVGNAAAFSTMFIAFGEALFHFYMQNRVFDEPHYTDDGTTHVHQISSKKLQTETSDEVFPYDVRNKNKRE